MVSGGILRKGDEPIARQMADFIVAMGISPKMFWSKGGRGTPTKILWR